MSSSEGSGPVGETAVTAGPEASDLADGRHEAHQEPTPYDYGAPRDPWFEPEPKQADWFLPTGRAGLQPESMTVSWDDNAEQTAMRAPSAGAPPWASESPTSASTPPPWESEPWPGPGEASPGWHEGAEAAVGAPAARSRAAAQPSLPSAGLPGPVIVATGAVPLVIPGLITGAIGLRRARATGSSQVASWLAIGLSLAWALIIIVVVAGIGGSQNACSGYLAGLRPAYNKAMADVRAGGRLGKADAADLANAATLANTSAAAAQDVSVRGTLTALAADLEQAHTDVVAQRTIPATLTQQLVADGAALSRSCGS